MTSLVVKKNPPAMQETWIQSLGWQDPLEKGMATHSRILAWRIPWTEEPGGLESRWSHRVGHGWGNLTSTQGGQKASQVAVVVKNLLLTQETEETQVWPLGGEDPLEEGMATLSSILAWRIPWTEGTGGLQSMGSQRIEHDWGNLACMHARWPDLANNIKHSDRYKF